MANRTIYSKTAKGLREASGKTKSLSRDLRALLGAIDGKSSLQELLDKLDVYPEEWLEDAIATLIENGFVRKPEDFSESSGQESQEVAEVAIGEELDFTALSGGAGIPSEDAASQVKAKQDAEAQAKREAEEKARREAEEKARKEADAKAKHEAEEKARREAEENARKEADAKAKHEAEEKARREAEESARKEAEAKAKREAEEKARREAEENARKEADAKAKREAEEKARREAEENARKEAEAKAKREAEEKARREAEENARKEAEAEAKREAEELAQANKDMTQGSGEAGPYAGVPPAAPLPSGREAATSKAAASTVGVKRDLIKWGKRSAQVVLFLIVAGLALVHVMPFDEQKAVFENVATAQFKQPVKMKALHLGLLPKPHWRLEDVSVGDNGQIRVSKVKAETSLGALLGNRNAIASVQLESPVLDDEGASWILLGKSRATNLTNARVVVKNATVNSKNIVLPALDATIDIGADGNWQKLALQTPDRKLAAEFTATNEGTRVEVSAAVYSPPLGFASEKPDKKGSGISLEDFTAVGSLSDKELTVSKFSGGTNEGFLNGNARLNWSDGWMLKGQAKARLFSTTAMVPALIESGLLSGGGSFSMSGTTPSVLMDSARAEGYFLVERGTLRRIDLERLLQRGGSGGTTAFSTLDGRFSHGDGKTQLKDVKLTADIMTASGNVDVATDKHVSGRFVVELKSPSLTVRGNLAISGTLGDPRFSR